MNCVKLILSTTNQLLPICCELCQGSEVRSQLICAGVGHDGSPASPIDDAAPAADGLWLMDMFSGSHVLLMSLAALQSVFKQTEQTAKAQHLRAQDEECFTWLSKPQVCLKAIASKFRNQPVKSIHSLLSRAVSPCAHVQPALTHKGHASIWCCLHQNCRACRGEIVLHSDALHPESVCQHAALHVISAISSCIMAAVHHQS